MVGREIGMKLKCLMLDNGGEYTPKGSLKLNALRMA